MLGVDRVVLDGGIEPQPVALLAMVEGPLELARGGLAPPAPAAAAATALLAVVLVFVLVRGVVVLVALAGLRGRCGLGLAAGLLLGAGRLGGLELGGDQGVVFGPQIDLVVEVAAAGATRPPARRRPRRPARGRSRA